MSENETWMHFAIRYDDYGGAYSGARAAHSDVEKMVQGGMAARGGPWLCAVTPGQSVDPFDANERPTVSLWDDKPGVSVLRKVVGDGLRLPGDLPTYGNREYFGRLASAGPTAYLD